MKCKNCGVQLEDDAKFCSSCGYPIKDKEKQSNEKLWFYYDGEQTVGPISEEEIQKKVTSNQHLVWCEGMEEWVTYGQSELAMKRLVKVKTSQSRTNLIKIMTYAAIALLAAFCFAPIYEISDPSQIMYGRELYVMLPDIGIFIFVGLAVVALGILSKKYFISFWITLIVGMILYVRLFFIPSVDLYYNYYIIMYGLPIILIVVTYIFLFVLVSILYYQSQKENVKNRYK